jgi:hypothetical protein
MANTGVAMSRDISVDVDGVVADVREWLPALAPSPMPDTRNKVVQFRNEAEVLDYYRMNSQELLYFFELILRASLGGGFSVELCPTIGKKKGRRK